LPVHLGEAYRSLSQRARVISEAWAAENLFCPNCDAENLVTSPANTPAVDFVCTKCEALFQLKGQSRPIAQRIVDAAYAAMVRAIQENRTPNLWAVHYDPVAWQVRNLLLIPSYAFSTSCVQNGSLSARVPGGPDGWDALSSFPLFPRMRAFRS
jgi:type II restriction enzyme